MSILRIADTDRGRGAWEDKGGAHHNALAHGLTGDGITLEAAALDDAFSAITAAGGGVLLLPSPKEFQFSNDSRQTPAGLILYAPGAVLRDLALYHTEGTEGVEVWGGIFQNTAALSGIDAPLSLWGTSLLLVGPRVRGDLWSTGMFGQASSRKVRLMGYEFDSRQVGDDSVYGPAETLVIQGQQWAAVGLVGEGTDDGIVVKAALADQPTRAVAVVGASIKGHANIFSTGTEVIGRAQSLVMLGGAGEDVANAIWEKVGKLASYEGSRSEGVLKGFVTNYDHNGARFQALVYLQPQRGGSVADALYGPAAAVVRAHPTTASAAVFCVADDTEDGLGDTATVERVVVRDVLLRDRLDGQTFDSTKSSATGGAMTAASAVLTTTGGTAFAETDVGKTAAVPGAGVAGATLTAKIKAFASATSVTLDTAASTTVSGAVVEFGSHAVDYGIYCEEIAGGIVRDVTFRNIAVYGCEQSGVFHNCASGSEVLYDGLYLENWGRSSGALPGFHLAAGVVRARNWRIEPGPLGGDPIQLAAGTTLIAEQVRIPLGTILNSTANTFIPPWAAPQRCYVYDAYLYTRFPAAAHATDYVTLHLGKSGASNFVTRSTQSAGFGAGVLERLNSSYPTGAVPFFDRDDLLTINIAQSGGGVTLTDAVLILRYVTH